MYNKNARRAFTLIEIMIVVLIIGILLAIAVPNFIKARESSRTNACIGNMKQINSATEQWAMDNKKNTGDTVALNVLAPPAPTVGYMKSIPQCPSNTVDYLDPQVVGTAPICPNKTATVAVNHILP